MVPVRKQPMLKSNSLGFRKARLGKRGPIAAGIGVGALDAYAGPNATATLIPGSKEGLAAKEAQGIGKIKELGAEKLQSAERGLKTAQTQEALKPKEPKELSDPEQVMHDFMTGNNGKPKVNPETKQPFTYAEAYQKVKEIEQAGKPEKAEK